MQLENTVDTSIQHVIDDSLAHGYASDMLRTLSKETETTMFRFLKNISQTTDAYVLSDRRAERLTRDIDESFGDLALWKFVYRSQWKRNGPQVPTTAVWHLPFMATRKEGIEIGRTTLKLKKRRPADLQVGSVALIAPHVLARLFQRDRLQTRQEVLNTLVPLASEIGLLWVLAESLGHRQWGIPIGNDALVIGSIGPSDDPESDIEWDVIAKTYIKSPLSHKWTRYLKTMNWAKRKIEEVYGKDIYSAICLYHKYVSASNTFFEAFNTSEYDWLKLDHINN